MNCFFTAYLIILLIYHFYLNNILFKIPKYKLCALISYFKVTFTSIPAKALFNLMFVVNNLKFIIL